MQTARERFGPLTSAEEAVIDAAVKGSVAALGSSTPPFGMSDMSRSIRGAMLQWTLTDPSALKTLHPAGFGLRGVHVSGSVSLAGLSVPVRVRFMRCAIDGVMQLTDSRLQTVVLDDSICRRIVADRMQIEGSLLIRGAIVVGRISLIAAVLDGDLVMDRTAIDVASGPALNLDALRARRVFLRSSFRAGGEVRLVGADLQGDLDCSGAAFDQPHDTALRCDGARIGGRVMLRHGFRARGAVVMRNAKVSGFVDASRARLARPRPLSDRRLPAFSLEGDEIGGGVNLHGTHALGTIDLRFARALDVYAPGLNAYGVGETALSLNGATFAQVILAFASISGEVSLIRTSLSGELNCEGAELRGGNEYSLLCDRASLGTVFLRAEREGRRPFRAHGRVRFTAAKIDGDLDCTGATLGASLLLAGALVTGTVTCEGTEFDACAGAEFVATRARIDGALIWRPGEPAGAFVVTDAHVGTLDERGVTWSKAGKVRLDGFIYRSISSVPTSEKDRRRWLAEWLELLSRAGGAPSGNRPTTSVPAVPQPYEQLATSLRAAGHELEARRVAYERQEVRRTTLRGAPRLANWFLGATIGHGFYPRRLLYCAAALFLTGSVIFFWARHADALLPISKRAYPSPLSWAPVYSLDALLPIVDLGQEKRWRPAPDGSAASVLTQGYLIAHILGGWLLATLGIAALTGLLRRDR